MRGVAALSLLFSLLASGCGRPPPRTACPSTVTAPPATSATGETTMKLKPATRTHLEKALIVKHGRAQAERIRRGLDQVLARWRAADGDERELAAFVAAHFISDPTTLRDTARRLEYALEMLDGHSHEVQRELGRFQTLDEGPLRPIDPLLAGYSPTAHITEDLFKNRIAFVALLNFPLTSLEQRLGAGRSWSRDVWAVARLTARFEHRLPPQVVQEIDRVSSAAEGYIDAYNIRMDKLASPAGSAGFPAGLRLVSHWGLRDEIRGQYGRDGALAKQRLIARIMERIIRQEIPRVAIDSDRVAWDPLSNKVRAASGVAPEGEREREREGERVREREGVGEREREGVGKRRGKRALERPERPGGVWRASDREPDTRYAQLLAVFRAMRKADRHFPNLPTHIDRVFSRDREIPEARMKALLESIVAAPVARAVAQLVRARLGRPLEAFDIWYPGFRPRGAQSEAALDKITRQRYPDAKAFQADLPRLFQRLGFDADTARFLSEHIVVDPARGPGHAAGAHRRDDRAHLRTRVGHDGMDYKGFNIAIHELGHNVEQVFSMSRIDHTLLEGVPATGFTEAFAFLFQARDLELLGQARPAAARDTRGAAARDTHGAAARDTRGARDDALRTLERFWSAYEISGVALLDMEIWRWMYGHPRATPAELRDATVRLAQEIWNRYFAPVLGVRDSVLLAIYSHIIAFGLYTPDYPLGVVITFQVEQHLKSRALGALALEMERMCRLGRLAPDVWMQQAVGSDVSSAPLLAATAEAVRHLEGFHSAGRRP